MAQEIPPLNPRVTSCLRAVRLEKRTGRLLAQCDASSRELYFRDGRIVGVRTTIEEERLGKILVRSGRITQQNYEDASLFVRHGWRLAAILVELKILNPGDVDPVLRLQALEVGCGILATGEQDVAFEETKELFTTLGAALAVPDLIMEAARRIENTSGVSGSLRLDERLFSPANTGVFEDCSNLTPEEGFLLSRFQGGATIETVLETCGLSESLAVRGILGLIECATLAPLNATNRPARHALQDSLRTFRKEVDRIHRRLERMDPWHALELSSDVGIATAQAAFRDAVRRYHPDRYQTVTDPEFLAKLESVCASFTTAYTRLTTALKMRRSDSQGGVIPPPSNVAPGAATARVTTPTPPTKVSKAKTPTEQTPERRVEPDDDRQVQDPEVYFREAKRAMLEGDYWRVIELLQVAIDLRNDEATYHFLLGEALSKNPRWRHDAERSYRRAMELAPHCAEYYQGLAQLYQSAGLYRRAKSLLEQVGETQLSGRLL